MHIHIHIHMHSYYSVIYKYIYIYITINYYILLVIFKLLKTLQVVRRPKLNKLIYGLSNLINLYVLGLPYLYVFWLFYIQNESQIFICSFSGSFLFWVIISRRFSMACTFRFKKLYGFLNGLLQAHIG